jgi:plasmid stabilization system protein ParE
MTLAIELRRAAHSDLIDDDVRRISAHRFPFGIYFRLERERIVVLSIFHHSRDPAIWQGRL